MTPGRLQQLLLIFASDSLRVGGMRGGWEGPHSPLLTTIPAITVHRSIEVGLVNTTITFAQVILAQRYDDSFSQ
jgi:hypothetical protein